MHETQLRYITYTQFLSTYTNIFEIYPFISTLLMSSFSFLVFSFYHIYCLNIIHYQINPRHSRSL